MAHVIEPSEVALRAVAVPVFVDQGTTTEHAIVCRFLDPQRRTAGAFSAKVEIEGGSAKDVTIAAAGDVYEVTASLSFHAPGTTRIRVSLALNGVDAVEVAGTASVGSVYESFVALVFRELTGRTVDHSSLEAWSERLAKGESPRAYVEHVQALPARRDHAVSEAYRAILRRVPNETELSDGRRRLQSEPIESLKASLFASQEYAKRSADRASLARAVHRDILGRDPTPHEAKTSAGAELGALANELLVGFEAKARRASSLQRRYRHGDVSFEELVAIVRGLAGNRNASLDEIEWAIFGGLAECLFAPAILSTAHVNPTVRPGFGPLDLSNPNWPCILVNTTFLENATPAFEWFPVLRPLPGPRQPQFGSPLNEQIARDDAEGDVGQNSMTGMSGYVASQFLSPIDVPFTHPFGGDFELIVSPDVRFQPLLGVTNFILAPCAPPYVVSIDVNNAASAFDASTDPDVQCADRKGFLVVEFDQGLIPERYRPAVGERVVVFGRWIVDAGHDDFHTEIHPPFAVVRGAQRPLDDPSSPEDHDASYTRIIARPYLVSQVFSFDGDGNPRALRAHIEAALQAAISTASVVEGNGDPNAHIRVDPVITSGFPPPVRHDDPSFFQTILTIGYIVRPRQGRRAPGDELLVSYGFIQRSGLSIGVYAERDAVRVTIQITDQYQPPPLPPPGGVNFLVNVSDLPADEAAVVAQYFQLRVAQIRAGVGVPGYVPSSDYNNIANQLQRLADNGAFMTAWGADAWPTATSPLEGQHVVTDVPLSQIALGRVPAGTAIDDNQPFPFFGWLNVRWQRAS